jgi:uncharacterized membrane protein YjfL (UPF0719 family)
MTLIKDSATLTITLGWVAYAFVLLITMYKSYEFFKQIEDKVEFHDVHSVPQLKNLYLASFIIQVAALSLTFLVLLFASAKSKK